MGLDQHAHAKEHKVNWDLFYANDKEERKKVFVFTVCVKAYKI